MIEFNEDLSRKLVSKEAVKQRVYIRVSIRKDEIPHYNRGIIIREFTYAVDDSFKESILAALSDFNTKVEVTPERVTLASIGVSVPLV